ncbi:alanine racemase [Paenibacillus sp. SYP-B4298]|uniref:alanine racemase n=1 Tax=Paenibacillus sp. SYP-B4298 TaxID=2996034 RepID=UPI0022DD50B3|nr:alanine racemase [Paenibacillus sp. SYP-B4298]
MMSYYRPTRAEISLDALARNLAAFRKALPDGTRLMASVKANAYGHGAVEISREAVRCGVDYLGVAFLDEAISLRQAGITAPILVLGYVPVQALELAREQEITIALFREDVLQAAARLPSSRKRLKVHIKIDTGMGRLGLMPHEPWPSFLEQALNAPGLEVEGLFTHFASADEADKSYAALQHERFTQITDYIASRGWSIPIMHTGNSAAGIDLPAWTGGMLRLGIGMYGLYPSEEVHQQKVRLEPVMSLRSEVVMVKQVPPGWGISYGTRYIAAASEQIGTVPIGYADGYSRMLTGKAQVLVRGRRVPVRGTICMDQLMIALDEAMDAGEPAVQAGEEVVLFGTQGDGCITVEEVADQLGTINYEVTCMLAARVPRVYVRSGQTVAVYNAALI